MGRQQWARFVGDDGSIPLKKLFYSLRPALAVRWLDQHPGAAFPPMTLGDLAAQTDLTAAQRTAIDELVALKAVTREMGAGAVPAVLAELVSVELRDRPLAGRPAHRPAPCTRGRAPRTSSGTRSGPTRP